MTHQIQTINNIDYYYDSFFDTLNIYLGKAESFYSEEEVRGVFFIKDEETDVLIGIEILDYIRRTDKEIIKNLLPKNLKQICDWTNIENQNHIRISRYQ